MPEPDLSFYHKVRFMKREAASSVDLAHEQWPPPYPHFSHNIMVHHMCQRDRAVKEGDKENPNCPCSLAQPVPISRSMFQIKVYIKIRIY
jgi:hypothetical protein